MKDYLNLVASGERLSEDQAGEAMRVIMSGSASPEEVAGFLVGVTARGATVDELVGFTRTMREFAVAVACRDERAIDVCGTGGDGKGTFNVSTSTALVAAGAGATVAKHGNRSVSSSCGSADVLEELGVRTELGQRGVEHCLAEAGIAFIFAPLFHPAMKHVMPVRRSLGVRTFFNVLGPLCNPAGVRRQLIGAFSRRAAEDMARVLVRLGADHIVTVHSEDGLDEISVSDSSQLYEYRRDGNPAGDITARVFVPDELGLHNDESDGIGGSTAAENAHLMLGVLKGEPGVRREIVLANAAHAIYVSGLASDAEVGLKMASESIDSDAAMAALDRLRAASNAAPRERL